jgi:hypothetical protein
MAKNNVIDFKKQELFIDDPITDILRSGARKLLAHALEIGKEGHPIFFLSSTKCKLSINELFQLDIRAADFRTHFSL